MFNLTYRRIRRAARFASALKPIIKIANDLGLFERLWELLKTTLTSLIS